MDDAQVVEHIHDIATFVSIMKWAAGVSIMSAIGLGITGWLYLTKIKDGVADLVKSNKAAREKEVETKAAEVTTRQDFKDHLKQNYDETRKLSHYVKVFIKNQTGKEPEPPMD